MYAGSPDILFRTPAELADGLALKELARFLERKFAPTIGSPAPARPDSASRYRSKRLGRPSAFTASFLCPTGTSLQTFFDRFRGIAGGSLHSPTTGLDMNGPSAKSWAFPPDLQGDCVTAVSR